MAYNNSYDFQNLIRDLSGPYTALIASQPTLISQVRIGPAATNTKHEWLEDQLTPTSSAISAFDTDGDGTGITVASTTGFTAGDIVRTTSSTGVTQSEVMRIVSVDSATELTVARDYGGTTGVTLDVGDIVVLISSPKNEGTDASETTGGGEASTAFNYTQIEDLVAKVSKTSQAVKQYGVENALNAQVERKLLHLARRQNNTLIHGVKVQRTDSVAGTAGGFLSFMAGGNSTNVAAAISSTVLNNAFEAIFDDGAYSSNYIIACAENQARKISAFNTTGSNPIQSIPYGTTQTGGFVQTFISDLGAAQGFSARVFVDPNMPKDQVAILDMDRVETNYLRTLEDMDATPPGADYFQRRLLMEYTFTIRDAAKAHALLTGLTV